jgi:nucleoid-associated protein YgaU
MAPQPRSEPIPEPKPAEAPAKVDTREPPRPAAAASTLPNIPGGKIYVVVEGDNLSSVAKKAYGPEEGNRRVNIERIIQANQATMKSPDNIAIGQKLIIPPLPKPAATAALPPRPVPNANRPADVLPKTLFERPKTLSEKVESLGRRASADMPAPTPEGRWYTVQDGDNLWKIAAGQLGGGSRWDEIHKLNAEILTSQDSLQVGMRLRLPPK